MEGKCAEKKAHAVPLEYHFDLPLHCNYENIIRKEFKLRGFPAHLFPFIIVIGLSQHCVIEVG